MADQSNHSAGEEDQEAPPRREAQAESLRGRREVYPLVHASMLFHTTTGVISFSVFSLGQSEGRGPLRLRAPRSGAGQTFPSETIDGRDPCWFLEKAICQFEATVFSPRSIGRGGGFQFFGAFSVPVGLSVSDVKPLSTLGCLGE